jgi:hypothetical protein
VLGGCDLIIAWVNLRRKIAVVAKRYDHVAHEFQYLYAGLKKLFAPAPQAIKRLIFKHQQNYHDYDAESIWGSRCIGISVDADDGAQLLGREFTDVVCGEGSHIPPHIGNTKLLRAVDGALMSRSHGAAVEIGYTSVYTTPKEEEGWSASEWRRVVRQTKQRPHLLHYGQVPFAQTVWIREASILENPAYERAVFEARKATLDKRAFAEQYEGKMGSASGRIYGHMDETKHIVPRPPAAYIRTMRLGLGIDTGGAFKGFSLCGIGRDRKKWILGEVYAERQTISYAMEQVDEMLVEILGPVFGANEASLILPKIEVWSVDPASQHKLELMEYWDVGLESPDTNDQKSVIQTTDLLNSWFEADELFISEDCLYTVDQYKQYKWKHMKSPRGIDVPVVKEPLKVYDHLCDSSRYVFVRLAEYGPTVEDPEPLSMAEAWEHARREAIHGPLRQIMQEAKEREEALANVW